MHHIQASVAVEVLQFIHRGMNMKGSVESRQPRAKLLGSAEAQWLNLSTTSGRSARYWLEHIGELPDSASSELYASTTETDSDDFDHAWPLAPYKFIRLNTIVVSKAKPILAESQVGTLTKFVGSNR